MEAVTAEAAAAIAAAMVAMGGRGGEREVMRWRRVEGRQKEKEEDQRGQGNDLRR